MDVFSASPRMRIPVLIRSSSTPAKPSRIPARSHSSTENILSGANTTPCLRVFTSSSERASMPRGRSTHWKIPPARLLPGDLLGKARAHCLQHHVAPLSGTASLRLRCLSSRPFWMNSRSAPCRMRLVYRSANCFISQKAIDDGRRGHDPAQADARAHDLGEAPHGDHARRVSCAFRGRTSRPSKASSCT